MNIIQNSSNIADIFAIPLFALMVRYFNRIQNKTYTEYILFIFSISGLMFDTLFTGLFLYKIYKSKSTKLV